MLGQFATRDGPKSVIRAITWFGDRLVWTVKVVLDMGLPVLVAGVRLFAPILRHGPRLVAVGCQGVR